jgi:hypothetical protein
MLFGFICSEDVSSMSMTLSFAAHPAVPPLADAEALGLVAGLVLAGALAEGAVVGHAVLGLPDAAAPLAEGWLTVVDALAAALAVAAAAPEAPALGHGVGSAVGANVHCAGPDVHAAAMTSSAPAISSWRRGAVSGSMSYPVRSVRERSRGHPGRRTPGAFPAPGAG